MEYDRPIVMSIAGLDPSGGAGILADIKTFEQHQCLGFGVASALTVQTASSFIKLKWLPFAEIKAQAAPLLKCYPVTAIKIGIIKDLRVLHRLIKWLKSENKALKIIWDPVLSASSGFNFTQNLDKITLKRILGQLDLITPNTSEALLLSNDLDENKAGETLSENCNVLLKGGHSILNKGTDVLYSKGERTIITSILKDLPAKHGSGCILSAAIASNMARGHSTLEASILAKKYIEKILSSNPNLLAYHV